MQFKTMLHLQKCMYFHFYLFLTWFIVEGFFLYCRLNNLGHLTKYLSLAVYTLLIVIEVPRIYLGHYGNLSCRVVVTIKSIYQFVYKKVPELAGFLMLTVFMQMPLVSFFLFNLYLKNTCMEFTLHMMLWLLTIIEVVIGFLALKEASDYAKSIYLSQPRER